MAASLPVDAFKTLTLIPGSIAEYSVAHLSARLFNSGEQITLIESMDADLFAATEKEAVKLKTAAMSAIDLKQLILFIMIDITGGT